MSQALHLGGAGLLASLAWAAASSAGYAADTPQRPHVPARHHVKAAGQPPAAPAPAAENLIVHGQKRFSAAPMPNQEIHDPADQLQDPSTGASMGRFGRAYIDANPVPPVNPGLQGDQSPIAVGVQR